MNAVIPKGSIRTTISIDTFVNDISTKLNVMKGLDSVDFKFNLNDGWTSANSITTAIIQGSAELKFNLPNYCVSPNGTFFAGNLQPFTP
jgi:hypothetical protein